MKYLKRPDNLTTKELREKIEEQKKMIKENPDMAVLAEGAIKFFEDELKERGE